MALPVTQTALAVLSMLLWVAPALGQPAPPVTSGQTNAPFDRVVSPECRVPSGTLHTAGGLPNVAAAVAEGRPVDVLALGSYPSGGSGSGLGSHGYVDRVQAELEKVISSVPVQVTGRRLAGETTTGAPEAVMNAVTEIDPNLVIWSAGMQDALARTDPDSFAAAVGEILGWLRSNDIDTVIVEPPYVAVMADDEHYSALVKKLREVAQHHQVPVVLRYDAMRYLSDRSPTSAGHHFRLHDLSRLCGPEYVGQTVAALLAAQNDSGAGVGANLPRFKVIEDK